MPTRRNFIGTAMAIAALTAAGRRAEAAPGAPTPTPTKTPAPSASPSPLAVELAHSLQRGLPEAHLSAAMTAKIAKDINDNFAISVAFRKSSTVALPPPDFVFVASAADRP
jgi:hypothetical protein